MFRKTNLNKLFLAGMALVLIAGLLGVAVQPAAAAVPDEATCAKYHTVQRGEYLAKIGRLYGLSWVDLVKLNKIANPNRIYPGQRLCVSLGESSPISSGSIWVHAVEVVEDQTVTIEARNLPAGVRFDVLLNRIGTMGVNGIKVGTLTARSSGTAIATFDIPWQMHDRPKVAIRIESRDGEYAYNWFYNATSDSDTGGDQDGNFSISVLSVVEDESVTIRTRSFPANTRFAVYMYRKGNLVDDGIRVATFNSGAGGRFKITFDIPRELENRPEITIRVQSLSTGEFTTAWFTNETTP
jgi:hypothetical protein